jgi:hypothetical protein
MLNDYIDFVEKKLEKNLEEAKYYSDNKYSNDAVRDCRQNAAEWATILMALRGSRSTGSTPVAPGRRQLDL